MLSIALLCLAVALPGLLLRRFGPWPARAVAGLVLAVFAAGVFDPKRDVVHEDAGRVIAVTTTGVPAASLRRVFGETVDVDVVAGGGDLGGAAAAAWLGRTTRRAPTVLALVWTGTFAPPQAAHRPLTAGAVALTTTPAPVLEPDECRVRARGPFEVGRPGALEVEVPRSLPGDIEFRARLVITSPDGDETEHEVDDAALRAGSAVAVPFEPAAAGEHRLRLDLMAGDATVRGTATFQVRPPRRVWVVGSDAAALLPVLRVQGVDVQTAAELPEDLAGTDAVILVQRVGLPQQQRLIEFVLDGGGLFVVGAQDGGAFPPSAEPLAAMLPVIVEPPRTAGESGEGHGAGAGEPGDEPPRQPPEPPDRPKSAQPPDTAEQTVPPPATPDRPKTAAGDTGGASVVPGPEVEVDRRVVAMVIVVDRSTSMREMRGGLSKMDYAKTSAYQTAEALHEGDRIGVVTFGVNGQVMLPLTDASDTEHIRGVLEGLTASDQQTLLANALDKAAALLPRDVAAIRHIVIVSDGDIHDSGLPAPAAAARARRAGITVSLIQIVGARGERAGPAHRISQLGGGKFYRTVDPSEVPRLVGLEVVSTLDKVGRHPDGDGDSTAGGDGQDSTDPAPEPQPNPPPPPEPEPEPEQAMPDVPEQPAALPVVALQESPLLEPVPADEFPPVGGVLEAEAMPESRVLLVARRGEVGVPLLAFVNRGLGKVGVWTSGLIGPWGAAWRDDPDFPARLAQWVSALRPPLADNGPGEVLRGSELAPPAPLAAERRALSALAGAELAPIGEFVTPPAAATITHQSRAPELAFAALLALATLALVEYLVTRWPRRTRVRVASASE